MTLPVLSFFFKSQRHQLNPTKDYWERQESNPGQLGLEASVLTIVVFDSVYASCPTIWGLNQIVEKKRTQKPSNVMRQLSILAMFQEQSIHTQCPHFDGAA